MLGNCEDSLKNGGASPCIPERMNRLCTDEMQRLQWPDTPQGTTERQRERVGRDREKKGVRERGGEETEKDRRRDREKVKRVR